MIQIGDIIRAKIVRVEDYGLWLESDGQTVFVGLLQASWKPLRGGCRGYFHPGDELEVKVYGRTDQSGHFFASVKELHPEQNPWRDPALYREGLRYCGEVSAVADYGYFVKLPPGADGLILLEDSKRALRVGEVVDVVIEETDIKNQRILLRSLPDHETGSPE
jgi:ribosomal protein S1